MYINLDAPELVHFEKKGLHVELRERILEESGNALESLRFFDNPIYQKCKSLFLYRPWTTQQAIFNMQRNSIPLNMMDIQWLSLEDWFSKDSEGKKAVQLYKCILKLKKGTLWGNANYLTEGDAHFNNYQGSPIRPDSPHVDAPGILRSIATLLDLLGDYLPLSEGNAEEEIAAFRSRFERLFGKDYSLALKQTQDSEKIAARYATYMILHQFLSTLSNNWTEKIMHNSMAAENAGFFDPLEWFTKRFGRQNLGEIRLSDSSQIPIIDLPLVDDEWKNEITYVLDSFTKRSLVKILDGSNTYLQSLALDHRTVMNGIEWTPKPESDRHPYTIMFQWRAPFTLAEAIQAMKSQTDEQKEISQKRLSGFGQAYQKWAALKEMGNWVFEPGATIPDIPQFHKYRESYYQNLSLTMEIIARRDIDIDHALFLYYDIFPAIDWLTMRMSKMSKYVTEKGAEIDVINNMGRKQKARFEIKNLGEVLDKRVRGNAGTGNRYLITRLGDNQAYSRLRTALSEFAEPLADNLQVINPDMDSSNILLGGYMIDADQSGVMNGLMGLVRLMYDKEVESLGARDAIQDYIVAKYHERFNLAETKILKDIQRCTAIIGIFEMGSFYARAVQSQAGQPARTLSQNIVFAKEYYDLAVAALKQIGSEGEALLDALHDYVAISPLFEFTQIYAAGARWDMDLGYKIPRAVDVVRERLLNYSTEIAALTVDNDQGVIHIKNQLYN